MRTAKTQEEIQTTEWRKRCFNQKVFFFETVDATMTEDANGLRKIQFGQTDFKTLQEWMNIAQETDSYCIDYGQDWYFHGLREVVQKALVELALR